MCACPAVWEVSGQRSVKVRAVKGGWGGGLYSLWCHLRKVLGPVKLSEWMECFFRRPRSTFFHCGTSVCLFLFQIHSIIPDCSKHSRTFQEPHIPFSTAARITNLHQPPPDTNTCLHPDHFFPPIIPHRGWKWPKKRASLSLFSPCWGIRVTSNEGKPSYFRHTWLVHCAAKKEMSESRHSRPAADEAADESSTSYLLVWLDSWDPGRLKCHRHAWLRWCTECI